MKTRKIKKTIEINAPKEKVWQVLLGDEFTRNWYAEFSAGTHAETDWKVGSKAIFKDESNMGIVGKIVANQPNEYLSIEYLGMVSDGIEDFESDAAKNMRGCHEEYKLSGENGSTELYVSLDMDESYFEPMALAWDKALVKIKSLAENL